MKKVGAAILAVVLAAGLSGCAGGLAGDEQGSASVKSDEQACVSVSSVEKRLAAQFGTGIDIALDEGAVMSILTTAASEARDSLERAGERAQSEGLSRLIDSAVQSFEIVEADVEGENGDFHAIFTGGGQYVADNLIRPLASVLTWCGDAVEGFVAPSDEQLADEQLADAPSEAPVEAGPSLCEASTAESIALLSAALDRVDRASSAEEVSEATASMSELFSQAGTRMGESCTREEAGPAASEIIVWASTAASERPGISANFAEGFLVGACGINAEFTPPAQVACSGL